MKLLDRYIFRQFGVTFVLLVLGLPLLFVIVDVTDHIDNYLARGVPMSSVALSYVYQLPQFVFWSLPIAGLVAWLTLGEAFTWLKLAGAAITMAGVAYAQLGMALASPPTK